MQIARLQIARLKIARLKIARLLLARLLIARLLIARLQIADFFVPIFLIVSFGSGLIISALFGDSYLPYKSIIPFIIIAQILGFYVRYCNIALRTLQHTVPIFLGYAITALLSVLCSKMLIHAFGFLGFGIGVVIFQIILIVFLSWHIRTHISTLNKTSNHLDIHGTSLEKI